MKITEERLIQGITNWLQYCDTDELSDIAGKILGGECYMSSKQSSNPNDETIYEFEPDNNYVGEFDNTDEDE
jgi:hypothetical protein